MYCFLLSCFLALTHLAAMQASDDFQFSEYWDVVDEIVEHMSTEQKIGHITLIPLEALHTSDGKLDPQLIQKYHLGALFTGGSEAPDDQGNIRHSLFDPAIFDTASLENYQKLMHVINQETIEVSWSENGKNKTVHIPLLVGTDSVHGNQHVLGSILFPHNIGLACAHDPDLIYQVGYWTAYDSMQSGFNWIFAPTTNRALNYQWGRSYETLGLQASDIEKNSAAFVRGAQAFDEGKRLITGALTTTKHFLGLGTTIQGADEGNVLTNKQYEDFVAYSFPEYRGAMKAHTGSIMCAYNAVDDIAMSINEELLHKVLKEGKYTNMPYDGFVVSDYQAISKVALQGLPTTPLHTSYEDALLRAVRAGLDMLMIGPNGGHDSVEHFQSMLRKLVDNGSIPMYRLNDAVKRILAVKYAMGLLQKAKDGSWLHGERPPIPAAKADEQQVALQAAQKSLVLLKNESELLPLNPHKLKYIILLGQREVPILHESEPDKSILVQDFDNIGAQNGGWTVCWQGIEGNRYWKGAHKKRAHATSLLDGLTQFLKDYPNVQLLMPHYSSYTDKTVIEQESDQFLAMLKAKKEITSDNSLIIVTLAESPYAEYMGDVNISYCRASDQEVHPEEHPEANQETLSGCLYNHHLNTYMPKQQRTTLRITWDPLTEAAIRLLQKKHANIPLLTILFSGRPMIVTEANSNEAICAPLPASTAFIAAWLPGTAGGEALANAIFGKYLFRSGAANTYANTAANTLAVDWIHSMKQLENFPLFTEKYPPKISKPLFPVGYGLATYAKSRL